MENQTSSIHQINANRANSEKSTGPKTEAGKQASSRNSTRHALTGHSFTLRYDESEAEYNQVLRDLINEHRPATTTEDILVVKLAQSYWLGQRAIRIASADMGDTKQLALMMRYQSLHDRNFQAALKQLVALRKAREAEEREEHLMHACGKSVDLDAKFIRLDLLRVQRDAAEAKQAITSFQREIDDQIAGLTRGLKLTKDDEPGDLAA